MVQSYKGTSRIIWTMTHGRFRSSVKAISICWSYKMPRLCRSCKETKCLWRFSGSHSWQTYRYLSFQSVGLNSQTLPDSRPIQTTLNYPQTREGQLTKFKGAARKPDSARWESGHGLRHGSRRVAKAVDEKCGGQNRRLWAHQVGWYMAVSITTAGPLFGVWYEALFNWLYHKKLVVHFLGVLVKKKDVRFGGLY